MTQTVPSAASFKLRFPDFDKVADAAIDLVLAEAGRTVIQDNGEDTLQTWILRDINDAILYLTAHLLTIMGEPSHSDNAAANAANNATFQVSDDIRRFQVDDVITEFFDRSQSASASGSASGSSPDAGLSSTKYGQRYITLRNRSHPPVLVV